MKKVVSIAQLTLLEKCLGLLGSDQDGEVLSAARRVAKIMRDNDLTWAEVLRKQVSIALPTNDGGPVEAAQSDVVAATNRAVQEALDKLRGKRLGNVEDFINSLDEQWARDKYLSQNQRAALFKIARNHA